MGRPCPASAEEPKDDTALGGHTKVVSRVAVTADGKLLATASYDQTVKLWDVATGEGDRRLARGTATWRSARTARRSPPAATTGPLKLWDVATRSEIATIEYDYHVRRLAFTPDGKTLITAGEGPIKLFDAATGKERATLKLVMEKNNANLVLDMAVTADGKTLCTGHGDGTIKLWDLGTGQDRPFPPGARSAAPGGRLGGVQRRRQDAGLRVRRRDRQTLGRDHGQGAGEREGPHGSGLVGRVLPGRQDAGLGRVGRQDQALGREDGQRAGRLRGARRPRLCGGLHGDGKTLVSGGGIQFERGEAKLWDVAAIVK